MTKDEALLMAIEALEMHVPHYVKDRGCEAINACKEALEQPTQGLVESIIGKQRTPFTPLDEVINEFMKDPAMKQAMDKARATTQEPVRRQCIVCETEYDDGIPPKVKQPAQEPVADDELHLAKHAKEYHGLTLNQFKLMCNEADKRYEGQFASSVDKHLAVESFYEGFKVAIKETKEQSTQESMAWISVDEKLPELNTEVMTWGSGTANNSFGYMQAWYSKDGWQELDSCGDFFNDIPPTHWIPLSIYTHPKEWKGLTAEEINSIPLNEHTLQAVENLLRSKNT